MNPKTESIGNYDVAVIGAGPAGCEASLAAAASGARTLCLTINLDTTGYHPANPTLVEEAADPRGKLLEELQTRGGRLPGLLAGEKVSHNEAGGSLIADRRELGLAYKEALENSEGLELHQSLVTAIKWNGDGWRIETGYDETFAARAVIIATGTFLGGEVRVGDVTIPGGRPGEIPSMALARNLKESGYSFSRIVANNSPRITCVDGCEGGANANRPSGPFPRDGSQLGELYAFGITPEGGPAEQLTELRTALDRPDAWINRPAHSVSHLVFSTGQLGGDLALDSVRGLFAAGKVAGSCNYIEAAALGLVSGSNAAAFAAGRDNLIFDTNLVGKLLGLIAGTDARPVTIRIEGAGC